jgi:hypothetical protein|uniref:Uncharacterized protein n=1 Tax=Panagrolaimus sp. PS1159 TaxID=55785 RepID=A0AC35FJT2_9BILA
MSGDGRPRKRNLLSGGPKTAPSRAKPTTSSNASSITASSSSVVPDSLRSSAAPSQGRQTRSSTLSQRTLEPFAFSQTRSTAKQKPVIQEVDKDDDDIQIIEEPKAKRSKRKKSEEESKNESFAIPDSFAAVPGNKNSERQGTPFNSIQSRKEKPNEVIPDSIPEVEENGEEPAKSQKKNKRNPKQAGLDEGLGEAVKAVKKIKLSTPTPLTNDLKNVTTQSTIRPAPPGKIFQKARQGSFYVALPTQRISVTEMSVWSGNA